MSYTEKIKPSGVHSIDTQKLKDYLAPIVRENMAADIELKQFSAGQSNPTYYVKLGNTEMVLRKKPPGKLLRGAHQIDREYRVMLALARSNFPVPQMIDYCENTTIIGTPFYVMQYLKGRVFSPTQPGLSKQQRRGCMRDAIKTLSRLHQLHPSSVGLDGFGKTKGYCDRVLTTWTKQYKLAAHKDIPQMSELISWLQHKVVSVKDQYSIIHGDYSIGNIMFHPTKNEVLAVLDWELSTIGHPLMDLAYFCIPYHAPPEYFVVRQVAKEEIDQLYADLPTEEELVRHYCQLMGIQYPIPNWNFYLALNFFKLASIIQGVYTRSLQGNASSPYAQIYGALIEPMIGAALKVAKREMAPTKPAMTLSPSPKGQAVLAKVKAFVKEHVDPREKEYVDYVMAQNDKFCVVPVMEELKAKAKQAGLWNLFLPAVSSLSNVDYAHIAEHLGRSFLYSEVFNCNAPDTGNMEVLHMYGSDYQKKKWLKPLMDGEIRSAFCMTEPQVASSDATNMELTIVRDGNEYVVNGRKWWSTGACNPRCSFGIVMGKTGGSSSTRHRRHSMIVVPFDFPGVRKVRALDVFGYNDAPHGHAEMEFNQVRVPAENLILGEGRGFEIAQGRLGPGRIHHCMRSIGLAERCMEVMIKRGAVRRPFGKRIIEHQVTQHQIAECRMNIDQCRLLTLHAAYMIDNYGAKGAMKQIAMIKVAAPRMLCGVIDRAIQIHGGAGVSQDTPLPQWYAAARTLRLADGPDEVHLGSIAKVELKEQLLKQRL